MQDFESFYKSNYGLIRSVYNKYYFGNREREDVEQELSILMWEVLGRYSSNYKTDFSTFYECAAKKRIASMMRSDMAIKRSCCMTDYSEELTTEENLIPEIFGFRGVQRKIVDAVVSGVKRRDLAEYLGVSRLIINREISMMRQSFGR